ncbi:MAG: phage tail protein [Pseudomonadota bacterium]
MSAPLEPRIGAQLYGLLPEVYRERDRTGDLAKYLDSCGELLDRVYATLRQRLDDHFPETCQEWLIPYFAELLDVSLRSPEPQARRAEVANAIAWRQRKGTAAVTEEIAQAVGAMEVELQEGWQRVARTARVGEQLPAATMDLRRHSRAMRANQPGLDTRSTRFPREAEPVLWFQANAGGVPCFPDSYEDRSVRIVDLRTPDWRRGHFHPKRLLTFVPLPDGFFPVSQRSFDWAEREQAKADGLLEVREEILTRADGTRVLQKIFHCPGAAAAPVRIRGVIELDDAEPAGMELAYRFEGFYLANTLRVKFGRLELERCAAFKVVVHAHDQKAPVFTATDCLLRHVRVASGLAQFEYCTVLGKNICEAVQAIDSLFMFRLQRQVADATTPPSKVVCLRNVRLPQEFVDALSDEDRKHIQNYTTEVPVFFRFGFGAPGAGVLHPATPASIQAGAQDGGELGAYHHQHLSLRREAVLDKLGEFLPFGMEAVLIPDARLSCVPPR